MVNPISLRKHASECRLLAQTARDGQTIEILKQMAGDFDAEAQDIEDRAKIEAEQSDG